MKFHHKYFAILASTLLWLFTLYLNVRQYKMILLHEQRILSKYSQEKLKVCPMTIHLRNHKQHPQCPISLKNDILRLGASKVSMQLGILEHSLNTLLSLTLYASEFLPWFARLTSSLSPCFLVDLIMYKLMLGIFQGVFRSVFVMIDMCYVVPYYKNPKVKVLWFQLLPQMFRSVTRNIIWDLIVSLVLFCLLYFLPVYIFLPLVIACLYGYDHYECMLELTAYETKPVKETLYKDAFAPMADTVGFPTSKILIVEEILEGNEDLQMNASMMGGFTKYYMIITDGLLETLSIPELQGIVGHELGHWYYAHTNKFVYVQSLIIVLLYYVFLMFMESDQVLQDFGFPNRRPYNIDAWMLWPFYSDWINFIIRAAKSGLSQNDELEADSFSTGLGFGTPLKLALTNLFAMNKSAPKDPLVRRVFESHPALETRLLHINKMMTRMSRDRRYRFPFKSLPLYNEPKPKPSGSLYNALR